MSIIAVHGFPLKVNLLGVMKSLVKVINGYFEALNFNTPAGQNTLLKPKVKTCYLRLSAKLDPVRVVEKINDHQYRQMKLKASIPESVPDIPLANKRKRPPLKLRKAFRVLQPHPFDKVLKLTAVDILSELQSKYPGLYCLSKKIGHKLLRDLYKKLYTRIKEIADSSPEACDTCFKMSRSYRRAHPHFGDFQLVLSTLHAIEDAMGTPRTQLQESELASVPTPPMFDVPVEMLRQLCNKYSDKILKKMKEHIQALPSEISPTDSEDEIARKQVREELKKLSQYLHIIVQQVIFKHLMPKDGPHYRIRVYGEPFLPNKETMAPFLARYKPEKVMRSTRLYNMLKFSVAPAHFPTLMAMNGTVLNGAKLIIRPVDMASYKPDEALLEGEEGNNSDMDHDEEDYAPEEME